MDTNLSNHIQRIVVWGYKISTMIKHSILVVLSAIFFASCIGDDIINDRVPERLTITDSIDTLGVGDTHQLMYQYTNNVGQVSGADVFWESSNPEIATIDDTGLINGIKKGNATIKATTISQDFEDDIEDNLSIVIDEETVEPDPLGSRSGSLETTSSYQLIGSFSLNETEGDQLILNFGEDFKTSDALPGLYVYLTNNPNSVNDAYEVGPAKTFVGAHNYDIDSEISLEQFSHVLMYCKPFNVKVGDGAFE